LSGSWSICLRKLRLSLLLPIVQSVITAVLTIWADRVDWLLLGGGTRFPPPFVRLHLLVIDLRRIWRGINSPTFPLNLSGLSEFRILGLGVGEILYLAAVVLLWYWVGRFFDRRRGLEIAPVQTAQWRKAVLAVLTLGGGVFLFIIGILLIPEAFPVTFAFGRIVRPTMLIADGLHFLWSLILVVFATRQEFSAVLAFTRV
jgi:hypothetical protein